MARILYGERFGVEPHNVNPPGVWWVRVAEWDRIRNARAAREYVDNHTAEKADESTRALYNWLAIESAKLSRGE